MTARRPRISAFLAISAAAGAVLAGCGSTATTTVTAGGEPTTEQPATVARTTTTAPTSHTTSTATTESTSSPPGGGAAAPSTTRTAPEPAFAQGEPKSESASAAAAVVVSRGYTPVDLAEYHEDQTLRVLVGTRTGAGEQAFFFLDGRFIGTDTKEPSAAVHVVSQNATEVTLAYPLYRSSDPPGAPSGGQALVHFQLDDGKLQPIGQIPPVSSATALSRR
jgi:hypothetical protein